jgi:hypothetical protein
MIIIGFQGYVSFNKKKKRIKEDFSNLIFVAYMLKRIDV